MTAIIKLDKHQKVRFEDMKLATERARAFFGVSRPTPEMIGGLVDLVESLEDDSDKKEAMEELAQAKILAAEIFGEPPPPNAIFFVRDLIENTSHEDAAEELAETRALAAKIFGEQPSVDAILYTHAALGLMPPSTGAEETLLAIEGRIAQARDLAADAFGGAPTVDEVFYILEQIITK